MNTDEMPEQTIKPPTWEQLVAAEPQLEVLLTHIRHVTDEPDDERFCADEIWQYDFKPKLQRLVGWHRKPFHPILSDSTAWEVAGDKLYRHLPPCRNC